MVRHALEEECSLRRRYLNHGLPVTSVPYCKLLRNPPHSGCCLACGFFWSDKAGRCVKLRPKDEL